MKNNIILILFLFIASSVHGQIQQRYLPKRTVIAGSVVGNVTDSPDVLTVLFCDPTIESSKVRNVFRISENRNFHAEVNIFFAQNTTIKYDNTFYNLFLSPGDSIYIKIDHSQGDICKQIVFSGNNAELNNQFTPFVHYLYRLIQPNNVNIKTSKADAIASFKRYMKTMGDSIDSYAKTNELMPEITEWAKREALYAIANQTFDYTANQLDLASDAIFEVYNPDNFKSMYYPYHLMGYMRSLLRSDSCFINIAPDDINTKIDVLLKIVGKIPSSISRDYILYQLMKDFISSYDVDVFDMRTDIIGLFSNHYFVNRLQEEVAKVSKKSDYQITIVDGISYLNGNSEVENVLKTDIFEFLKKRSKGKVVYIDIYATWCGPCKTEITAAKTLHDVFCNKDVVFVYLCLGSKVKDWQSMVAKSLKYGENYFFDASATDLFTGTYSSFFNGFPTFVVIDREGNLLTKNIPRPSSADLIISFIDSLLQQ